MRIRTVKPEFWKNEIMSSMPEFTRLLALALLNYADDEGYFNANPVLIRGELFPFVEDSSRIHGALIELGKCGYISIAKSIDGRFYGRVVNFQKHQKIDCLSPSKIKDLANFDEPSASPRLELASGSRIGEGDQGAGIVEVAAIAAPTKISDEDWLTELATDLAYASIDVRREFAKMSAWCKANKKQPTRRRFINWLNRVEAPMETNGVLENRFKEAF